MDIRLEQAEEIYAIYHSFSLTIYGQKLSKSVRYKKYNLAKLDSSQWVELLGVDVNNLVHMLLTYRLMDSFIEHTSHKQPSLLRHADKRLLTIAAIIHDQAESLVGDTSFGDKTHNDDAKEHVLFVGHIDRFSPGISPNTRQLLRIACSDIVFKPGGKLGQVLNAVERVGYMRTMLRASDRVHDKSAGLAESGLRWLIADVLLNQIDQLLIYADKFLAVKSYLRFESHSIDDAFKLVKSETFGHYGVNQIVKHHEFSVALKKWDQWKSSVLDTP